MIGMAVQNYDIKTLSKIIGTTATSLGLGVVPSGMKRWVTFIRADNKYGGNNTLYFASATAEAGASTPTLASAAAKDRVRLQTNEEFFNPPQGPTDPRFPLFSIAEANYLSLLTDRGDAIVFMQYYDK